VSLQARILAIILLLVYTVRGNAEPVAPRVQETTPTMEACSVDPALALIQVRFDQPMGTTSWSWCGGGEHYPEIAGTPSFKDDHTALLPVKLKPQTTYFVGINCPSAQRFRSTGGIPVQPTTLQFTTGSGSALVPARADNYKSWNEFRRLFRDIYSYYDRTGTDWEKLFDANGPCILESPTVEEFVYRLSALLGHAEDPHLALATPDGQRIRTHHRFAVYNGNESVILNEFPNMRKHNRLVWSAVRDDIGYLSIHGWNNQQKEMDVIQDVLKELSGTRVLILDVRGNGGGGEGEAGRVATWFLDEGGVYATHRYRDTSAPDGWTPMRSRRIDANQPDRRYTGKVLVLQGPVCLSSNEAFLEMMRLAPRATSIGDTSGGSSANPRTFDLPNGAKVTLPRWQSYKHDGSLLEGHGIDPDIRITGDFRNDDPVLREALRLAAEGQVAPSEPVGTKDLDVGRIDNP
jgi:hypothetical protein